jgi:hypothetical protein
MRHIVIPRHNALPDREETFDPCRVTPWSIELAYCELNEIVGIDAIIVQ